MSLPDDLKRHLAAQRAEAATARDPRLREPKSAHVALGAIAIALCFVYAGHSDYAEAKRQEAERIPYFAHPLRGEQCDITISQRSYGPWSAEKCAKAVRRSNS